MYCALCNCQMDLDIQGRTVRFNVEANYESIGEQATTFCTTYGAEFGVTQETLGECEQNIQRALEERVVAYLQTQQQQQTEQTPAAPVPQEEAAAAAPTFQVRRPYIVSHLPLCSLLSFSPPLLLFSLLLHLFSSTVV